MYPTKSFRDYMMEINRIPKSSDGDIFQSPLPPSISALNSFGMSSSSTDTSPESFPDLSTHRFPEFRPERSEYWPERSELKPLQKSNDFKLLHDWKQENYEPNRYDPRNMQYDQRNLQFDQMNQHFDQMNQHFDQRNKHYDQRNQFRPESLFESRLEVYESMRAFDHVPEFCMDPKIHEDIYETPLIARRQRPIVGRKIVATVEPLKTINEFPIWQPNILNTPPKGHSTNYELFPSENRGYEFPSPVKTSPGISPMAPSPKMTLSPASPRMPLSPRMPVTPQKLNPQFKTPIFSPMVQNYGAKMCTFCRKNGETPMVYMTHLVKEKVGNKQVVTCPILRSHICSECGVSGDNAHTITYCPVLRSGNNGVPLQSTTITLKNTRVKSNGRRRY